MTQRENNGRKLTMKEIFEALSRASKGDNDARQQINNMLGGEMHRGEAVADTFIQIGRAHV